MMIVEDYTPLTKPWLWRPRPTIIRDGLAVSGSPPRIIEIHCTRGGSQSYDTEYNGTINWTQSDNNRHVTAWGEVWGSSCTYIVNGQKVARILPDDVMPTYSAGYGGAGTWPVDFCAVSIEVCQPYTTSPIPHETRLTVAELCASLCRQYAIPVRRLMLLDQTVWPPPSGLVGHEDTANGRILGKTDPGPGWVWNEFLWEVREKLGEEEDMPTMRFVTGPNGPPFATNGTHKIGISSEDVKADYINLGLMEPRQGVPPENQWDPYPVTQAFIDSLVDHAADVLELQKAIAKIPTSSGAVCRGARVSQIKPQVKKALREGTE